MALPAPRHRYTFQDYLDIEEVARVRHEFYDGEIYAMAGGTPEHAAMAAAVTAMLGRQLVDISHPTAPPAPPPSRPRVRSAKTSNDPRNLCRVYSSDLRVRVRGTGLATYPDVTVICGPSERDPESSSHVTNPKLVVEVLSDSTAEYDRGEKLQHYQHLASLEMVVLIDHTTERVERWTRGEPQWQRRTFGAGDQVPLDAIDCTLSVDEVYAAAREA